VTRFIWYQILVSIRTLFYSRPETGIHVTEMIIYDWSLVIVWFFISCWSSHRLSCCNLVTNYEFISHVYFCRQKFSFSCHIMEWTIDAINLESAFWSWIVSPVCSKCVMVIMFGCRILGTRVYELEKKLKTLEMTGLWNVTGKWLVVGYKFYIVV